MKSRPRIHPLLSSLMLGLTLTVTACGGGDDAGGVVPASGFTLLGAATAPSNAVGNDGDFFLDSSTGRLYGPKAGGVWPSSSLSLVGPAGPAGAEAPPGHGVGSVLLSGSGEPNATVGRDGDFYVDINTFSVYGPKSGGFWRGVVGNLHGSVGPEGPAGPAGDRKSVV